MNRPFAIAVLALGALAGAAFGQVTTTLVASPSPATLGQSVTLTATVAGANNPAGTVTFYNGSTVLGSTAISNAAATIQTIMLPPSTSSGWTLTAKFFNATHAQQFPTASTTLTVTAVGSHGFSPATPVKFPNFGSPARLLQADFNNDGVMDFAIYRDRIGIALGNGDGTFSLANGGAALTGSVACADLGAGDFNGDGNIDLACLRRGGLQIDIFFGTGLGTFGPPAALSVEGAGLANLGGQFATALVVADLNGDGIIDLATPTQVSVGTNVGGVVDVFVGKGDGTFQAAKASFITPVVLSSAGASPFAMTVVPLSQGRLGLLAGAVSSNGSFDLFLLLSQGDGTFTPASQGLAAPGFKPFAPEVQLLTGDFNNDGLIDVAYRDAAGIIYVAKNPFNAFFTTSASLASARGFMAVGDFNGDGNLDLAGDFTGGGKFETVLGNGTGTFGAPQTAAGCGDTIYPASGDYNGDHKQDIAGGCQGTLTVQVGSGPAIASLTPASTVAGAKNVTFKINGSNFFAGDTVQWQPAAQGSSPTTLTNTTVTSQTLITVGPSAALDSLVASSGTAQITVLDASVTPTLASNPATFTMGPGPAITSIAPLTAARGGTSLTLIVTGQNFVAGDTLTWTPVGGTATTLNATLNSNGTLSSTITGAQAATLLANLGQVTINVVDPSGVSGVVSTPNFAVVSPAAMTGLNPASVGAGSTAFLLTIVGSGLVNGDCVTWTQKTPQVASPVSLTGTPPCNTTVTVSGNQQQIVVNVPANLLATAGTSTITVLDLDGAPSSTPQTFTVAPPSITGLADKDGVRLTSVGTNSSDFTLTVNGTNFITGSTPSIVLIVDPAGVSHAHTPTSVTPTQITVTVAGADVGNIANTVAEVIVLNPAPQGVTGPCPAPGGITGACSNSFPLAVGAPSISNVNPSTAPAGGTASLQLVVSGANFVTTSQLVWCNNCNGAPQTIKPATVTSGQMVVSIPATLLTAAGTVQISVTNTPLGSLTDPNTNTATQQFKISTIGIANISPTSVVAGGPAFTLTINGQNNNFDGQAQVLFGGGSAAPISPSQQSGATITSNQIIITVPASYIATAGSLSISVVDSNNVSTQTVSLPILPFSITSVSPSSLTAGSPATSLNITGTGFTSGQKISILWTEGTTSTPLTNLTVISDSQITADVSQVLLAQPGTAQISAVENVPGGTASTLASQQITVSPPSVSSLAPNTAATNAAAFLLTVNGSNFLTTSSVQWTDSTGKATPLSTTFVSGGKLSAFVQGTLLGTSGTALVSVLNGTVASNGVVFSIGPTPTINTDGTGLAVCPTGASCQAANSVQAGSSSIVLEVNGLNYQPGAVVNWAVNGTSTVLSTAFVFASANNPNPSLNATVPASLLAAPVTAVITVQNPGISVSNAVFFTVSAGPPASLTAVIAVGPIILGSPIQLAVTGANFVNGALVQWSNGTATTGLATIFLDSGDLSAVVPANLVTAPATVSISVQSAGVTTDSRPFTIPATSITSLDPATAAAGSDSLALTVTGGNFNASSVVQWSGGSGPQNLTTSLISATQLSALVPANLLAAGGTAFVSTVTGTLTSNALPFTILRTAGLTITSLSPSSAATGAPGIALTVTGAGFVNGAVTMWSTGATPALLATGFVSPTQLTVLVPASFLTLPATALITVQNPDKTASNATVFLVTGSAPATTPTLTSILPASASAGAATLQLSVTGQSFVSASDTAAGSVVQWNGSPVPTSFVSPTQLTATVDASLLQAPGANFVSVMNGSFSSGGVKFQVNGPSLSAIAPTGVTAGSGAFNLVLTGTNFVTGSTAVWNTSNLPTTVSSATQLTAQVPANLVAAAGSAFVLVTNPGGASTLPQTFTIATPAASILSGLNPPSAIAGGPAFQLTVTGTGFVNGSVVLWNGSPLGSGFLSATQVFALIDASLISTAGSANVTVQNPGAPPAASLKFSINGPAITTLTPSTANAGDPAFTLTVAGTNFVPGSAVQWNGAILPSSFGGAAQLLASVPAAFIASPGTASISVLNPGGAVSAFQVFTVGQPALRITTAVLPDGVVGAAYSQSLIAQGGNQPYTWTLTAGNLPGGMSLDAASGTLSGVPTGAATGSLGITVTDSLGRVATRPLQLNVVLALTVTTVSPLPMATAGTAYSALLAVTGGSPSYLWSATGAIPPGLSLNVATGQLSGLPTTPGSYTFTISVTDSRQQQNATKVINLAVTVGSLNITGLTATAGPAQQVSVAVTVGAPYPTDLTGNLTVSFTSAVGGDDPSIQFSTGGRTVTFTIPAGATTAVYPQNQQLSLATGTVAGTITIKAALQAGAVDITPAGLAPVTTAVAKQPPVIASANLKASTGGVVVAISGYSTTKELTQATLQFNAASGSSLTSGTVTVPLTAILAAWYQSAASAGFGSQFTVSVPISVQGSLTAIGSVTVTLTNTQGNSAPVTAPLQ